MGRKRQAKRARQRNIGYYDPGQNPQPRRGLRFWSKRPAGPTPKQQWRAADRAARRALAKKLGHPVAGRQWKRHRRERRAGPRACT